jgi:UDP-N-acetylmuramoyl-tripeptide--D-alanyl-D-alanine ligase
MQPVLSSVLLRGLGALAGDPEIASVVTDSREAGPGSLFVCIRGERVDGHDYALRALEAGAAGVVVQRPVPGVPPEKCVQVPDALDAMIRLGANYRALYSPLLAGVTGSVGKTTTKEFCYAVFSAFGKTLRTEGNQNNEIGMPNTLFRLDKSVEYAVWRWHAGPGRDPEADRCSKACGRCHHLHRRSHLEQLGTRENILRQKLEICEGCRRARAGGERRRRLSARRGRPAGP